MLWVIKGLGPGGAETLLAAAARAHDRDRFHIECAYVLPYKDHLVGDLEAAGVRTHCLSDVPTDARWPLRLARLVRSGDWDVVHVHSPLPGSVARLAVRSMRADRPGLVTTEHNAWGTFAMPTRWLNRVTAGPTGEVIAVSDEARASMTGRAAKRARTLVHGIDVAHARSFVAERSFVRAELGLGADEMIVGTVANFRPQKDYPNLLQAMRILADRGVTVRLVAVGQGPLERETRAMAVELGLQDRVLLTGFRADAVRVLAACDVFTLASRWEGLPVALMEALAIGLPVVATDVGGVRELLRNEVDALLVPLGDAVALADALEWVVRDGALRQRLATTGAGRAGEFDVSRTEAALEAAYTRVARPKHAAEVLDDPPRSASKRQRAPQPSLQIRPATPEDRPAILSLLQRSLGWGDDPRFTELYRWKHELNAFGPSPTWVATDGKRVVGVRIFMRWEFLRGGRVLRAVRAVDTATDPDYQGRGLFTRLTLHALDEMRADGVDFVFNTPNDQSRPGYLKMGWRQVGNLPAAVRPAGLGSVAKMARARVPSDHWSQPISAGAPFDEWADRRHSWGTGGELPVRMLTTNTSEAFYRWRFGLPVMHYRVVDHGDGAVVVRARRRGPALELVQVAAFGLSSHEADRATAAAMKIDGADHAIRLGRPNLRAGFVPLPGGGPVLTWRDLNIVGLPPLSNWSLTMGDIELM